MQETLCGSAQACPRSPPTNDRECSPLPSPGHSYLSPRVTPLWKLPPVLSSPLPTPSPGLGHSLSLQTKVL